MREEQEPQYTPKAVEGGGWVGCLTKGDLEIWFGGGPGIGRLGETFARKDLAEAAVQLALDKVSREKNVSPHWRLGDKKRRLLKELLHHAGDSGFSIHDELSIDFIKILEIRKKASKELIAYILEDTRTQNRNRLGKPTTYRTLALDAATKAALLDETSQPGGQTNLQP